VSQAGSLKVDLGSTDGLITGTTLGGATDTRNTTTSAN